MTSDPITTTYGHYNARSVDPRVVAEHFVAPPQFWEIVPESNTVLSGPRGSGKTTLLKMLEATALERWENLQAPRAREAVTYSGVFVPADRSWAGQVDSVYERFDPELRTALGLACFSLHMLRGLTACAAMRIVPSKAEHPHDRVSMERDLEERIVRETWENWGLNEPVGTFTGLRFALSDLLLDLGKCSLRARREPEAVAQLKCHAALDLKPVEAMIPFIERFNHAVGQEAHVWMFLVDEIEFLPPVIRSDILGLMRAHDPRIMQKCSLAPYTSISSEDESLGAWVGHDYQPVDLTFPDKEKGYDFNEELVRGVLARKCIDLTPEDLLGGRGEFESDRTEAYAPGTTNAAHIQSLAEKDRSFREWLCEHGLDAGAPGVSSETERAATLRKAMPIIRLRDEFLRVEDGVLRRRSRKQPRTYVGALSAYAICEGNPRLLIALVERLVRLHLSKELDDAHRADSIDSAAREYERHLRALAIPASLPLGLLPRNLVDRIGKHFEEQVLAAEFDPEPALSFEVDREDLTRLGLKDVLMQLVHYGAFVPISDQRFRLAHMFAPNFHLPLRRGRPHALRSILGPSGDSRQLSIDATEEESA